jgi:hypothetical protein
MTMAKDLKHQAREERLQVMLTPMEVSALDDFRFRTRMPSRAAAIRELLKRGPLRKVLMSQQPVAGPAIMA